LKKLGNVYLKTRSKLLIVKPLLKSFDKLESIVGAEVYSSDLKRIGSVIDIIGKISNPYIVVKPISPEVIDQLDTGSVVYFRISKKRFGKASERGFIRKQK